MVDMRIFVKYKKGKCASKMWYSKNDNLYYGNNKRILHKKKERKKEHTLNSHMLELYDSS